MGMNVGYLTCNTGISGDEVYTPYYAVAPLLKYIPKSLTIWCPFDKEWSAFYKTFKAAGYKVIKTSENFFKITTPPEISSGGGGIIVSNPPFSKKDKVMSECLKRNLPFVLLLPIQTLQGINRYKQVFSKLNSFQLLCFDKRVGFHTKGDMQKFKMGNHFASFYFIGNIKLLPQDIVFEELEIFDKALL